MEQYEITDQAQYPWRTIVYIEATFPSGNTFIGSGVMVGPNDVLTAAHVVYDPLEGGGASYVEITPAFDPSPLEKPYGTVAGYQWQYFTGFDSPPYNGLISEDGAQVDIALISLDTPLGDQTGWMGLDPGFSTGAVNITGYPGFYDNNLMNVTGSVSEDPVYYTFDFSGQEIHPGNSGGPVWYTGASGPMVIGVVSTGSFGPDIYYTLDFPNTQDDILGWMSGNEHLIFNDARNILGTDSADFFQTGAGNDRIAGRGGNDQILGGAGADSLTGGAGSDTVVGNAGFDTLRGGGDGDLLRGGQDGDMLFGGLGSDELRGAFGNDTLRAGNGDDVVGGGQGNDQLFAGIGNDNVAGGQGSDTLTGSEGADAFVFATAPGVGNVDTVVDFEDGIDKLHLSASIFPNFGLLSATGATLYYNGAAFATFSDGYTLDLTDFLSVA